MTVLRGSRTDGERSARRLPRPSAKTLGVRPRVLPRTGAGGWAGQLGELVWLRLCLFVVKHWLVKLIDNRRHAGDNALCEVTVKILFQLAIEERVFGERRDLLTEELPLLADKDVDPRSRFCW